MICPPPTLPLIPYTHTHTQVNKNTGFFNGLYTTKELDAKSIQVCVYASPQFEGDNCVHMCQCWFLIAMCICIHFNCSG